MPLFCNTILCIALEKLKESGGCGHVLLYNSLVFAGLF